MEEEIMFRKCHLGDLPAVKRLISQYSPLFFGNINDDVLELLIKAQSEVQSQKKDYGQLGYKSIWVAEIKGEIIGMMPVFVMHNGLIKSSPIFIDKTSQRKIGPKLLGMWSQFLKSLAIDVRDSRTHQGSER